MRAIRAILEGGVPMLRNKLSGHGQGPDVVEVPGYVAGLTLNLTASNTVFLMDANRATNRT
jgi:SNF2 family DNA or RNA helicase